MSPLRIALLDNSFVTVYSYSMTKKEKLLKMACKNPKGLSFTDFTTLMKRFGWALDHQTGSHKIWYSKKGYRISVQNRNSKAKGYQVRRFLSALEEERL